MARGKGSALSRLETRFSRRTWRIIAIAAGVLALAVIVLVSSALAPSRKPDQTSSAAKTRIQSKTLTDRGLGALSANDTATAEGLLKRAVALDPQNRRAAAALARIRQQVASGKTTSGNSGSGGSASSGGSTTSASASPFDKKVARIGDLLPISLSGYTFFTPVVSESDAQVSGDPAGGGMRVIWAVHDRGSKAAASRFISAVSKRLYPKDSSSAVVDGATAYLGTDGSRVATAVYVRGRYVFEVLVSAGTASSAISKALPTAKAAAVAFPDQP